MEGFADWELELMARISPETRQRMLAALDKTDPMTSEEWDSLIEGN